MARLQYVQQLALLTRSLLFNSNRLGRQDIICSFLDSSQSLDLHSLSGSSNCTFCILWIISNCFGLLRPSLGKLNYLDQIMQVEGGTTLGICLPKFEDPLLLFLVLLILISFFFSNCFPCFLLFN